MNRRLSVISTDVFVLESMVQKITVMTMGRRQDQIWKALPVRKDVYDSNVELGHSHTKLQIFVAIL